MALANMSPLSLMASSKERPAFISNQMLDEMSTFLHNLSQWVTYPPGIDLILSVYLSFSWGWLVVDAFRLLCDSPAWEPHYALHSVYLSVLESNLWIEGLKVTRPCNIHRHKIKLNLEEILSPERSTNCDLSGSLSDMMLSVSCISGRVEAKSSDWV